MPFWAIILLLIAFFIGTFLIMAVFDVYIDPRRKK